MMIEAGLTQKWILRYWPETEQCGDSIFSVAHALSLEDIAGVFILLLVGVSTGLAILFIENFKQTLCRPFTWAVAKIRRPIGSMKDN